MEFSGRLSALRHPQFLKYWLGSFTSVGATQLQVMALGWLVYELSNSSLALGYLGAAYSLPAILLMLFGGALADRFDKRFVMMITSLATTILLGVLAYLDYAEIVEVWHVIVIAALISIVFGFDWPVRNAIFPALIHRDDMMSAVALTTIIWQATRMVMPAIGGVLIAISDTWLLFALCSLGFFFMYFVMLSLNVKTEARVVTQSTLSQIADGVRFIVNDRTFLILLSLSYTIFFFAGSYQQLMPAFSDLLGVGEQGYGYLLSITGVGAVTGTFISGSLQNSHRLGAAMLGSAGIFCAFVYVFALVTYLGFSGAYTFALATVFSASVFVSIFMITSTTVLQLEVPDELRGRVMGVHAITYNMMPLGGLFAGFIASLTSPPVAIAAGTTIFLAFLLWVIATQGTIRRIDGAALAEKVA